MEVITWDIGQGLNLKVIMCDTHVYNVHVWQSCQYMQNIRNVVSSEFEFTCQERYAGQGCSIWQKTVTTNL